MMHFSLRSLARPALAGLLVLLAACGSPEERAQKYIDSGKELLAEGDYARAKVQFRNALELQPESLLALRGLAEVSDKTDDRPGTIGALNRIVELDPQDADARVRIGRFALIGGDIESAVRFADEAIALSPDDPQALSLYAAVRLRLGDQSGAIDAANKALTVDPGTNDARIVLVAERVAAGDLDAALDLIAAAPEATASPLFALTEIRLLERLERSDEAVSVYDHLVEQFPNNGRLRRSYGLFLLRNNDNDAAEAQLRAVVDTAEDDEAKSEAITDVIRLLNTVRGRDEATAELDRFIADNPSLLALQLTRADFDIQAGLVEQARKSLRDIANRGGIEPEALEALNRLTRLSLRDRDIDGARALVNEALGRDSTDVPSRLVQASLIMDEGRVGDAINSLRELLQDKPDASEAYLLLAQAHISDKNLDLAESNFARGFDVSEADASIALPYARFLVRRGKADLAEETLVSAIQRDTKNVELLQALADVRVRQQDWAGADEVASYIRQLEPENEFAASIIGEAKAGAKDFEEGIALLEEAQQSSPQSVRPLVALVRTYVEAGRVDDAVALLEGVASSNPDVGLPNILLGRTHLVQGNLDAAKASFGKAVASQPTIAGGYEGLYTVARRQGADEEALSVLDDGLAVRTNDIALLLLKAGLLEQKERFREAIDIYQDIHARTPENTIVANNLASLLSDHPEGEEDTARALTIAKTLPGDNPYFLDTLGWAYFRSGDIETGTSILRNAVETAPNVPIFRSHLAQAFLATGQTEAGRAELRAVIDRTKEGDALRLWAEETLASL